MGSFSTRAEAMASVLASATADPEVMADGVTIVACRGTDVCGKVDPAPEEQETCMKCEVIVISPGGTA